MILTMSPSKVYPELEAIKGDPDFPAASGALAEAWAAAGAGVEVVEPIFRFMEAHPDLEYGMPGGLVHLVERFHQQGYEEVLMDSVTRRPTWMTTWMLNRLINGTYDETKRIRLRSAMRSALAHPLADGETVEQVRGFLEQLSERSGDSGSVAVASDQADLSTERDFIWLGLLACVVLAAVLAAVPLVFAMLVNPWLGVGASVLSLALWVRFGPRPMPGLVPGIVAVNGLFLMLGVLLACVLMALRVWG